MSSKLDETIQKLPPDQLRKLAAYAEQLLAEAEAPPCGQYLELRWAGKAADAYPEHASGVEAAHAALDLMRQSLERGLCHYPIHTAMERRDAF